MLPLRGIRVIDLTTVAMGPYASQWLGDFGADVIKVETPAGDSTRHTGPTSEPGMSAMYLAMNRNKRSIVLDLKTDGGRRALGLLTNGADVFLHNVRPQKLKKLALDPETLIGRNARLVYAGLHGFAKSGPYGGRPAYDDIIQGLSGNADLMRRQSGEVRYFPAIQADKTSGLIAAVAILAALTGRERTGKGSVVEVPMFESMVSFNLVEHFFGAHFAPALGPFGYPRVMSRSRRPYATADGHVCMMPYTDAHWRSFFEEAGAPAVAADPRFFDIGARTRNIDALYITAEAYIAQRSTADWLAICDRRNIPAGPVLALEDLPEDPHLKETGFFETFDEPRMGTVRLTGVPVLLDDARPPTAFPPRLGEHTDAVLAEIGMTRAELG